jgi:hypothetical protein
LVIFALHLVKRKVYLLASQSQTGCFATARFVRSSNGGAIGSQGCLSSVRHFHITTHYSAAEIGELIAATNRICAAKGTPSITLLRVANG